MTLFSDTFTRANSSTTTQSTDYDIYSSTSASRVGISNNQLYSRTASTINVLLIASKGPTTGDQFAAVNVNNTTAPSTGLVVRATNPNNETITGYAFTATDTEIKIYRMDYDNAVSSTVFLATTPYTRANGDRFALIAKGSSLFVYLNGNQVAQATDTRYTTGRVGIRNYGAANIYYDNFDAGDYPTDATSVNGIPAVATNAPGQVVGLNVVSVTEATINASWTALAGATSYNVEYRVNGTNSWTSFGTPTSTSVSITPLNASTTYQIRVTGINSAGTGTPSSTVNATTTQAATSIPGAVTNLSTNNVTVTSVSLAWSSATGATSYSVEYKTNAETAWTIIDGIPNVNTIVGGLAAGTLYNFRVTGVNTYGAGSTSNIVNATTTVSATVTITSPTPRTSGLPSWRGLIYNPAGERILAGDLIHKLTQDFWGPVGSYTLPSWLINGDGAAPELTSASGIYYRLLTTAVNGNTATLKLNPQLLTTDIKAVYIELDNKHFAGDSPTCDFKMFAASGNAGAGVMHISDGDTAFLYSQGENNRTPVFQGIVGVDAKTRKHIGLLVSTATKEVWLLERDSVVGYRDCSSTWTDGNIDVGVSITNKTAAATALRFSSLSISIYA